MPPRGDPVPTFGSEVCVGSGVEQKEGNGSSTVRAKINTVTDIILIPKQ